MRKIEVIEQLFMILVILLWIPWIFGYNPSPWYEKGLYATAIPLLIIFVNRIMRYRQAVRDAEQTAEQRGEVDTRGKLQ